MREITPPPCFSKSEDPVPNVCWSYLVLVSNMYEIITNLKFYLSFSSQKQLKQLNARVTMLVSRIQTNNVTILVCTNFDKIHCIIRTYEF